MSKSKGNAVNPIDMVNQYGIDTYRYFLLRDVPFGMDGNFSEEAIIKRFNGDLANDLGNLVYRTLTMIEKYYQGAVPDAGTPDDEGKKIYAAMNVLKQEIGPMLTAAGNFNFGSGLEKIWGVVNMANKYVEQTKPWNLAKENKAEELKVFIRLLVDVIRVSAAQVYPFMPQTAELIKEQIGAEKISKGKPLFPRIE